MDAPDRRRDATQSFPWPLHGRLLVPDDHRVAKGAEKRDIRFSLRIPSSLHVRLKKAADEDRRTMADFTLFAIEHAVEAFEAASSAKKSGRPSECDAKAKSGK
jgi:predicted DNA-binding protein